MSVMHKNAQDVHTGGFPWWKKRNISEILSDSAVSKNIRQRLPLDCTPIDGALRGGFPACSLIEIVGKAGSGKTQMCLTLAGKDKALKVILYIYTEGSFPIERLREIIRNTSTHLDNRFDLLTNCKSSGGGQENLTKKIMDHVILKKITTVQEWLAFMNEGLLSIRQKYKVKMLILDSVANVFRHAVEFSKTDKNTVEDECNPINYVTRAMQLWQLSNFLRRLALEENAWTIVTNQVTQNIDAPSSEVRPALGQSWSECLDYRFLLERLPVDHGDGERYFKILQAPCDQQQGPIIFHISSCGITA